MEYIKLIKSLLPDAKDSELAEEVLSNSYFVRASGSGAADMHHFGDGGLAEHTYEVIASSLKMADFYGFTNTQKQDLYFAALFHDYGKMYDYTLPSSDGTVLKTEHYYKVYHVSRSSLFWNEQAKKHNYSGSIDDVLHAILSHHQLKEWGSPVTPKTPVAWILHCCDSISARINELQKL